MNIVVLDGYALNPGDLSWEGLKKLGNVTIYDRTPDEEILSRSRDAEILITNKTPLTTETMESLPELKYIGVLATGYNVVDTVAARDRGITVTNVPAYSTVSVAQMIFALILELCHHAQNHSNAVRQGKWSKHIDFCFWDYPLVELAGKTIGIVGLGRIGSEVARIAEAFRMKVIAYAPRKKDDPKGISDFKFVDLDTLLRESDIVTLNCPLKDENKEMINKERLSLMKKTAFLINASRGGLINDSDLAEALKTGKIAGAAMDVLSSQEPPTAENPMLDAPNCIITPHIAWATKEARTRLLDIAIQNVETFIAGSPINVVN